jgi:hypothetical protein
MRLSIEVVSDYNHCNSCYKTQESGVGRWLIYQPLA